MKYRLAAPEPGIRSGRGVGRRAFLVYGGTRVERANSLPSREPATRREVAFRNVLGESPGLKSAVAEALRLAVVGHGPLVLIGEPGTGKSLFARAIHDAGPRADEPFLTVSVPTIPARLLKSQLFGHEARAFAGARARARGLLELAGRGTVYFAGMDHLPPNIQPKLLRALEERRARRVGGIEEFDVNCTVVAGTTHGLEEDVFEGTFRDDLFYRLNGARVELPPLRNRGADVRLLADHFLFDAVDEVGFQPKVLSDEAASVLEAHSWPGNVRELKAVAQEAATVSQGPRILAEHLRIRQRRTRSLAAGPPAGEITMPPEGLALDDVEKEAVRLTLEMTGGNQSAAARALGVSRPTLLRKAREHGLEPLLHRRSSV